jgi:uncharacterized protein YbdZ (MbtH family)
MGIHTGKSRTPDRPPAFFMMFNTDAPFCSWYAFNLDPGNKNSGKPGTRNACQPYTQTNQPRIRKHRVPFWEPSLYTSPGRKSPNSE